MIIERNHFDIPPMKNGAVVDITDIVTTAFENAVLQNLGNSVKVTFSTSVPKDSQFYPLDRNVPQYLYPHLSEFVRTGTASTELRNFIAQVITVQANNVIQRVQASGHPCLEFHPSCTQTRRPVRYTHSCVGTMTVSLSRQKPLSVYSLRSRKLLKQCGSSVRIIKRSLRGPFSFDIPQ